VIHELVALDAALGPAELEEGAHRPIADAAPQPDHAAVPAQHRVQCPGWQTHHAWCSQAGLSMAGCLPSGKESVHRCRQMHSADRRTEQLTPVRGGSAPLIRCWRHAVCCEEAEGIDCKVLGWWHKPRARTRLVKLSFADGLPKTLAVRCPPQSLADAGAVHDVMRPQTQQDRLCRIH